LDGATGRSIPRSNPPRTHKNPTASRQELAPQIHAISDETHRKIHSLLTDHQKELKKAMQQREMMGRKQVICSACHDIITVC
jgi:hypothetical protein